MESANPIGFLQEYCVAKFMAFPRYEEGEYVGKDHCREFTCKCYFLEYNAEGKGNTKKGAKRASAEAMVKILMDSTFFESSPLPSGVIKSNSSPSSSEVMVMGKRNAIAVLQEHCQQKSLALPSYVQNSCSGGVFVCNCILQEKTTIGKGTTKKVAKKNSALKMLQELNINVENLVSDEEVSYYDDSTKNPISALNELCAKMKLPAPVFEAESTIASVFTMKVRVGEYAATGVGPNKQGAKTLAASKLLEILHAQGFGNRFKSDNKWNPLCENVEVITDNLDDILPDFCPEAESAVSTSIAALSLNDSVVEVEPSSNSQEEV